MENSFVTTTEDSRTDLSIGVQVGLAAVALGAVGFGLKKANDWRLEAKSKRAALDSLLTVHGENVAATKTAEEQTQALAQEHGSFERLHAFNKAVIAEEAKAADAFQAASAAKAEQESLVEMVKANARAVGALAASLEKAKIIEV